MHYRQAVWKCMVDRPVTRKNQLAMPLKNCGPGDLGSDGYDS